MKTTEKNGKVRVDVVTKVAALVAKNKALEIALLDFVYYAENGLYIERACPQVYRAKKALKLK